MSVVKMDDVRAYCTLPASTAVEAALGTVPWTAPPLTPETVALSEAEGCRMLYFRLHGLPQFPRTWFGETNLGNHVEALTSESLAGVDMTGVVVVLANCYGTDSPLVFEFYAAGATAVIAGPGPNMAAGTRVIGTDKLAQWILKGLRRGLSASRSLWLARQRLRATSWRAADRDALGFKVMEE